VVGDLFLGGFLTREDVKWLWVRKFPRLCGEFEEILTGEEAEWSWVRKIPSFQANLAKILTGGGRTVVQVRKNVKNYHLRDGMELVGEKSKYQLSSIVL